MGRQARRVARVSERGVGNYIILSYYDQPLMQIARVEFENVDGESTVLVQVDTLLCTIEGERPWERAICRFSRDELVKMIAVIDGEPVEDFFDGMVTSVVK